jgi:hypothetical protein
MLKKPEKAEAEPQQSEDYDEDGRRLEPGDTVIELRPDANGELVPFVYTYPENK